MHMHGGAMHVLASSFWTEAQWVADFPGSTASGTSSYAGSTNSSTGCPAWGRARHADTRWLTSLNNTVSGTIPARFSLGTLLRAPLVLFPSMYLPLFVPFVPSGPLVLLQTAPPTLTCPPLALAYPPLALTCPHHPMPSPSQALYRRFWGCVPDLGASPSLNSYASSNSSGNSSSLSNGPFLSAAAARAALLGEGPGGEVVGGYWSDTVVVPPRGWAVVRIYDWHSGGPVGLRACAPGFGWRWPGQGGTRAFLLPSDLLLPAEHTPELPLRNPHQPQACGPCTATPRTTC